jgi:hypothetical protein
VARRFDLGPPKPISVSRPPRRIMFTQRYHAQNDSIRIVVGLLYTVRMPSLLGTPAVVVIEVYLLFFIIRFNIIGYIFFNGFKIISVASLAQVCWVFTPFWRRSSVISVLSVVSSDGR